MDVEVEAVLIEMAAPFVAAVEPACVGPEEPVHPLREVRLGSLDRQVEMIGHETPVVERPAEPGDGPLEHREELATVRVVPKDGDAIIATGHDVVESSGVVESERPGHTPRGYLGVKEMPRLLRDVE